MTPSPEGNDEPRLFGRVRVGILVLLSVSCLMAFVEDGKEARSLRKFLVETRAIREAKDAKNAVEREVAQENTPESERDFVVTSETLTDKKSGLEWPLHDSTERLDWAASKAYCAELTSAGGGWHLPSRDELLSLLRRNPDPLDGGIEWFWSANAGLGEDMAWAVGSDSWLNANPVGTKSRARCVRSGR
ncbi:MAG: DUF1566 domain-containing protein [Polyangiaceae bacterium]